MAFNITPHLVYVFIFACCGGCSFTSKSHGKHQWCWCVPGHSFNFPRDELWKLPAISKPDLTLTYTLTVLCRNVINTQNQHSETKTQIAPTLLAHSSSRAYFSRYYCVECTNQHDANCFVKSSIFIISKEINYSPQLLWCVDVWSSAQCMKLHTHNSYVRARARDRCICVGCTRADDHIQQ